MNLNHISRRLLRYEPNVMRMLTHVACGLLCVILYEFWLSQQAMLLFLGVCLIVGVSMEVARHYSTAFNHLFLRLSGALLREPEMNGIHAGIPYVISCLLVILIFSKPIAILSILFLALGDPAASFAGKCFGDIFGPKLSGGKSVFGTIAAVLTCTMITYVITKMPLQSIIFGLMGGLAEMLPLPIDDNFSAPIISASMMWVFDKLG